MLKGRENTFLGGLDWTVLVGKEIMGKSSERVGGGEEVAGVLEAGVPFPPEQQETVRQNKNIPGSLELWPLGRLQLYPC